MPLEDAVRSVDGLSSLLGLLKEELDWPFDESPTADDVTFDWTAGELRLPESAADRLGDGSVRQLQPFNDNQPWGIFLVEFTDGHIYRSALRQVLRGLVPSRRGDPGLPVWEHENLLFICSTHEYDRFTFAHFRGEQRQKAKLATFSWEQGDPYVRTLCEYNLPRLRFPEDEGDDAAEWLSSWSTAFDKEPLTREFFKRFDKALDAIKADLLKFHRPKPSSAAAYSRAQLLLERLIFLYFLQKRGWLNQNPDFLLDNFRLHEDRPDAFNYYGDFLETLFWSLATPPLTGGTRLSGVPFLNGGLFDDDEFAQTPVRRKQSPPLLIRNETFALVFSELLEAFNFTVTEDTPLDQDVAVDPEMLGKVFESIVLHAEAADPDAVAPDKRKATGSYYTPRIVVHFICQEAIFQYLLTHLEGDNWRPRLRALLEFDATNGLGKADLNRLRELLKPAEGRRIRDLVKNLTCCDPAVGSGAFPVGLLHELVNLRRVVEAVANGYVDPAGARGRGPAWLGEAKAHIVENCLYGVDIQQQAIEICRLRLWLGLVVDYPLEVDPFTADRAQFLDAINRISQLPNLEMNFRRGDSLHDHISGVPIILEPGRTREHRKALNEVRDLGRDLHRATKAKTKKKLRVAILAKRLDVAERVLHVERHSMSDQSAIPGLVPDQSGPERRLWFKHQVEQIDLALTRVQSDREELKHLAANPADPAFYPKLSRLEGAGFDSPLNFSWHLDFPTIFGREGPGFDVIVGNPPFVTARNPKKRDLYRSRWKRVCAGNYLLLCPFFDLSFNLLRKGGELGFIVSNAFAKRKLGKPLVEVLFPTVDVQKVIDCSGLSFPGHGTPTCLLFAGNLRPAPDAKVRVAGILPGGGDLRTPPERSSLWHSLAAEHDNPGYRDARVIVVDRPASTMRSHPWQFDASGDTTKKAVEAAGRSRLGEFALGSIGRDATTQAADIYYLPSHVCRRLAVERKHLKPLIYGELIRNWVRDRTAYALWPYNESGTPTLSKAMRRALAPHRSLLERRSQFRRTTLEAGLQWYEYREYHVRGLRPQVMYADIATHNHFALSQQPATMNQHALLFTPKGAFDFARGSLWCALLNSSTALFWLKQVCFNKGAGKDEERDRFEYAGGTVERLPVPSAVVDLLDAAGGHPLALLGQICLKQADVLPSLAFSKLFECEGEAYHAWHRSLPAYVRPHHRIAAPFSSAQDLRDAVGGTVELRESAIGEMIACQEELDWLVYIAYGLLPGNTSSISHDICAPPPPISKEQRPFALMLKAGGAIEAASALIPGDWEAERKRLWRARLEAIRDNEHVRAIEQPVYKRRWDEQWKIGNRWECGQAAYDAEFVDAFHWWLSEKAESWLEHKAGGPVTPEAWASALWTDSRIKAAWTVAAEADHALDCWRSERKGEVIDEDSEPDTSRGAFLRFLRRLVKSQTVPEGIPFATPWDELAKRMKIPAAVRRIRGKLNVPRERFWVTKEGLYRVARPFGPGGQAPLP